MRRVLAQLLATLALLPACAYAADPEVRQLLDRATLWEQRERDDLAREALERALRLAPDDADALVAYARLQLRANQEREASDTLERLRRAHPRHPGVAQISAALRVRGPDRDKLSRARQLARAGRTDEALAAYRALFPDAFPDDEVALEHAQLIGASAGGWERARELIAEIARRHPQDARYTVALHAHVASRKPVPAETMRVLRELASHPAVAVSRQAREAWRRAVLAMDVAPETVPALREYIEANPGETAASDRLAFVQREIAAGRSANDPGAKARREGWAALEAGRLQEAEAKLQDAVARLPRDGEAAAGLALVRLRQGRHAEALVLFERAAELDPAARAKWDGPERTARYWVKLAQAREAREAGRLDAALALANEARALDPQEPGATMEIARIHLAAGRDREAEALVAQVSEEQGRTLRQGIDSVRASRLREQAKAAESQSRASEAAAMLERAAALDPDNPWVRHDLARLYASRGEGTRARALFDDLLRRRANDAEVRYAYALFLSAIDRDAEAMAALEAIAPAERTVNMSRLQRRLWISVQGQRAAAYAQRGERAEAQRILAAAREAAGNDLELSLEVGRALDRMEADAELRALLDAMKNMGPATPAQQADVAALQRSLTMRQARALRQSGRTAEAIAIYRDVLRERPGETEAELALIESLMEQGRFAEARPLVDAVLARSPAEPRALAASARLARLEGRLDEAIEREQRALATGGDAWRYRQLAEWIDESTAWSWAALDWLYRSGTPGKSRISAQELPVAWKQGWTQGGRWFARASVARVAAGTLDMGNSYEVSTFGSMLLCQPLCPDAPAQTETGATLAAGFERGGWKLDLGTTPIGFPVVNVVGGVSHKGELGAMGYTVELARRSLPSSLLSYAGTRDPNTGRTWGGVVTNGVRLNVSRDSGGDYGAWGLAGLYRLTGRNVLDNDKAEVMGGLYRRFVNEQDRLLTLGVAGMWWRFSENAGEFTFGHGGYYSPRDYRSVSLPATYAFRSELMSFALRASVSVAWSESRDAPFYPTDPELQRQAEALVPTSFVDPFYRGKNEGRSYGRAFGADAERQIAPGIFLGGRVQIERSTNYTPSRFLLYVRFALDGRGGARPVSLPPEPGMPGFGN